ncbi:hypothetical protein [uncultured Lactobacillus sp.]|uniref:hypothetical protein n=1 Tax=uncultured Lactobacillus sp. TaxID=153152 RepID=UPI0025D4C9E2|nr:hypothetical protein [uncultured Lactobacillus sp.]
MKISLPKIFISPANYIQAKDILFNSVTYLKRWGKSWLLLVMTMFISWLGIGLLPI